MSSWLLIAGGLAVMGILMAVATRGLKSGWLSAEASRKLVHLGMGLLCLLFPWCFSSVIPVQVLGAVSVLALLLVRLSPWKSTAGVALFSVERISIGEVLFPVAVAWLFTLSFGRPLEYVIPLLLLTLADTAGAFAGTKFGRRFYRTRAGKKTYEGSLAFFVTAFLCCFVPLVIWGSQQWSTCLVVSLTIALFITAVEGASGRGLDNLFIPIGSFLLLDYYLELSSWALSWRLAVLLGLLALLLSTRRKHTLDGGALLCALLFGFASVSLGSWICLFSVLILFARHLWAQAKMANQHVVKHPLDVIFFIAIPALTWLTLGRIGMVGEVEGQFGFIASLAMTIAMMHSGTKRHIGEKCASIPKALVLCLITLLPSALLSVPLWWFVQPLIISGLLAWIYFRWRGALRDDVFRQWAKLGLLAFLASASLAGMLL